MSNNKLMYRVMFDKSTNNLYAYDYLKGEDTKVADIHIEVGYFYGDYDTAINYFKEVYLDG